MLFLFILEFLFIFSLFWVENQRRGSLLCVHQHLCLFVCYDFVEFNQVCERAPLLFHSFVAFLVDEKVVFSH